MVFPNMNGFMTSLVFEQMENKVHTTPESKTGILNQVEAQNAFNIMKGKYPFLTRKLICGTMPI
jgi:hypothetical protein